MNINSIKSGAKWSLLSQLVEVVVGLILITIITRILGPTDYGVYQTILAIIMISTMISDFGISTSVSRYIATNITDDKKKSEYITYGVITKILFMSCITLLLFNLIPQIETLLNIELEQYKKYIIIIVLMRSMREFLTRVYQGLRRLDIRATMNSLYFVFSAIFTVLLLYLGYRVEAIFISEIIVSVVLLIYFTYKMKYLSIKLTFTSGKAVLLKIIKYAIPMLLISISFYIYTQSDILMIQSFLGTESVGIYALATMIIGKVHIPLVALGQSTAPAFATLSNNERSITLLKVFKITLLSSMPLSIGTYLVSEPMVIQVFGHQYYETILILKFLSVFLFFYCLNSIMSPILDYLGYAKVRSLLVGVSAGVNILLNLLFIPTFGVIGAVYSTLITYTIYSLLILFQVVKRCYESKLRFWLDMKRNFYSLILCNLVMVGIVLIISKLPIDELIMLTLMIILGALSYMIMIILTKTFSVTEIKTLLKKG